MKNKEKNEILEKIIDGTIETTKPEDETEIGYDPEPNKTANLLWEQR